VIHFAIPLRQSRNYASLPKADLVFFTHDLVDHFDLNASRKSVNRTPSSSIRRLFRTGSRGRIMSNGERLRVWASGGAVPANNLVRRRPDGPAQSIRPESATAMCSPLPTGGSMWPGHGKHPGDQDV
jgi:hypothetical protein